MHQNCNPFNTTKEIDDIKKPSCYVSSKKKKKSKMTPLKALALDILENRREVTWNEAKKVLYPVCHKFLVP
jgi:hypothetical protein